MRPLSLLLLGIVAMLATVRLAHTQELSKGESIVLPTERCGNFFIAETMIDGEGPFAMVLDTGASITTLSPEAMRRAGSPRHIERLSIGDMKVTGRIRVQAQTIEHLEAALGTPIDGILGHQVFNKVLLTYDYPAGEIRIRLGALDDDMPGVAPMSTSKRPFIGARIDGQDFNVLLDTGSSNGLTLGNFDRWSYQDEPKTIGGSLGIDGLEAVRGGRLVDDVRIASISLATPVVRSHSGDSLLGQAILRDVVLTVDQQRGRVQIVTSEGKAVEEPITSPSMYDASWILWPESDHLLVRHVIEGGAAAKAGIRRDDRIMSINGKPFADIACERHAKDGDAPSTVMLVVERGDETIEIEMTSELLVR